MANFLLAVDPDEVRRSRFLQLAARRLAPVEGLARGELNMGSVSVIWAASPRAPIDVHEVEGAAAVRWGIAVGDDGREVTARSLTDWQRPLSPLDGFYALLRLNGSRLELATDILGLFPLYHAWLGDEGVLLAGSSPRLFPCHPLFDAQFDLGGLVAPLLFHFPFDGRTPWRGVRRLSPGHVLASRHDKTPEERRIYSIPKPSEPASGSLAEHAEALHSTWDKAVLRQLGGAERVGILLSGGRDSRELVAILYHNRVPTVALTLGDPRDHEARCASAVAAHLGMEHVLHPVGGKSLPWCAQQQVRWEHLSSGFGGLHMWDAVALVRCLPDRLVTGYIRGTREVRPHPGDFDAFFAGQNRRGFSVDTIHQLLREPRAYEIVASRLDDLREAYGNASSDSDDGRWRFQMGHRMRFHSGAVPWRLSFGSWPIVPMLDRDFLGLLAGLPPSSLQHRRAQDWALVRHHPGLAHLPMDRNDGTMDPVLLSPVPWVMRRVKKWSRRAVTALGAGRKWDPRYFYRLYDFDGPGWRAVRQAAEPHRERLEKICDPVALAELLPAPDQRVGLDPMHGAYSRKLLVGLALWLAEEQT